MPGQVGAPTPGSSSSSSSRGGLGQHRPRLARAMGAGGLHTRGWVTRGCWCHPVTTLVTKAAAAAATTTALPPTAATQCLMWRALGRGQQQLLLVGLGVWPSPPRTALV
jgi:hypothetical protein